MPNIDIFKSLCRLLQARVFSEGGKWIQRGIKSMPNCSNNWHYLKSKSQIAKWWYFGLTDMVIVMMIIMTIVTPSWHCDLMSEPSENFSELVSVKVFTRTNRVPIRPTFSLQPTQLINLNQMGQKSWEICYCWFGDTDTAIWINLHINGQRQRPSHWPEDQRSVQNCHFVIWVSYDINILDIKN